VAYIQTCLEHVVLCCIAVTRHDSIKRRRRRPLPGV